MDKVLCTDRIRSLKDQQKHKHSDKLFHQRRQVFERVFAENRALPMVQKVARAQAAFLMEKEISISSDDLLAGNQQLYDHSTPDDKDVEGNTEAEKETLRKWRKGYRIGLFCGALGGHVIAGYRRVLESGFGAMIAEARKRVSTCSDAEKAFCEASLTVCEAAANYARRYAASARQVAEDTPDGQNRLNLLRVAESCEWIATDPPRSFHEALQLLWITHEIITAEQRSGSLSLGRLDQVLYPFYRHDVEHGALSGEEAQELIEALWIKFAGLKKGFQNITLGGTDGQGNDLTNDLSLFFLRATKNLRMDQPLLSVRWHEDVPEDFWQEVQDLVQEGMGFPALFNEELVIEAKKRMGVSHEDAAQWGIVGCVEPSIPGKEFSHTEGIRVNWAKILELMLNEGRCAVNGEPFALCESHTLLEIDSFDEFYRWYRRELQAAITLAIEGMNILDREFHETSPYPFLSSTMEGCLEAGLDITAGSTVYNFGTVNTLGMANVADSLTSIKQTVFDNRVCSLSELADAVNRDFEGKQSLLKTVRANEKYGNDQKTPDTIISELCDEFHGTISHFRNGRGGAMQCGFYTVDSHGPLGEKTGSMPDGRLRGIALANALAPVQGSDTVGPTAVIKSCTKVDHLGAANGMVLDLKFTPSFFRQIKEQGIFTSLVRTYFERNGMEIQFNVIARETLEKAKSNPEQYEDLVVRVSGFSAYFVDLPHVVQEEIIARTEYAVI